MTYSFTIDDQSGFLLIKHRGKFCGAETDVATLVALAGIPLLQRRNISRIGIDLRGVDSATLQDTDGARVRRSERQLRQLLEMTSEEYSKHLQGMTLAGLLDPHAPVRKIVEERLIRVERVIKFGTTGLCSSEEDFLRLLDLPPDFNISG